MQTFEDRFWSKVQKGEGCWEWTGSRHKFGYGWLHLNGATCTAHRISWTIHNGEIPAGLCVRHTCDNPGCVNPGHLLLGTKKDNTQDMMARGRHRPPRLKGEDHHEGKLSNAKVILLRRLLRNGMTTYQTARMLGVSQPTVSDVKAGRTWRHI